MRLKLVPNPWGLSPMEVATLQAMCAMGTTAEAAALRNVTVKTVEYQIWRVRKKMQLPTLLCAIVWDRWIRKDDQ